MLNSKFFRVSPEIKEALRNERPVVALESTVIAHGLPRPVNLEVATRLQQIVTDTDAVPATIAIIDGVMQVGLKTEELRFIAESNDVKKISTRDLALAVAKGWTGATTVASSIWIAHRAGLKVFATGGIGGVHRHPPWDVSADLTELARTPITVICSGAKVVLDLAATREWMETHGITVVGYQCDRFPAFYSRSSGLPVDIRVDLPTEIKEIVRAQRSLSMEGALLVTVPVPSEAEVPSELLERILLRALSDAETKKISGREVTPFLLSRMAHESDGATLQANIALLENNARVAAQIAANL